jgi:hypothetical protein
VAPRAAHERFRSGKAAYDDLAKVRTGGDSDHRKAVNQAIKAIERDLKRDPLSVGESRAGDNRVVHEWPIGVDVLVDQGRRVVTVLRVWGY